MSNLPIDQDNRSIDERLTEALQDYAGVFNVEHSRRFNQEHFNFFNIEHPARAHEVEVPEGSSLMSSSHHAGPSTIPETTKVPPKTDSVQGSKSNTHWFLQLPYYDYILPAGGLINFTMVEIITLLPQWYRNQDIAARFQNNLITTTVHFNILQEHHDLGNPTLYQCQRARDYISTKYRQAMRQIDPDWYKARHATPAGWDMTSIQMNNFLPDVARKPHYSPPAAVPFRTLAQGLKKFPAENDAADLTRALLFALGNQRIEEDGRIVDYMFPNDLQIILDRIGRTVLTPDHSDPAVIARYDHSGDVRRKALKKTVANEGAYKNPMQQAAPTPFLQQFPPAPPSMLLGFNDAGVQQTSHGGSLGVPNFPLLSSGYPTYLQNNMTGSMADSFHLQSGNMSMSRYGQQMASPATIAAGIAQMIRDSGHDLQVLNEPNSSTGLPDIPDCCQIPDQDASQLSIPTEGLVDASMTLEELDALMAANQSYDFSSYFDPSDMSGYLNM